MSLYLLTSKSIGMTASQHSNAQQRTATHSNAQPGMTGHLPVQPEMVMAGRMLWSGGPAGAWQNAQKQNNFSLPHTFGLRSCWRRRASINSQIQGQDVDVEDMPAARLLGVISWAEQLCYAVHGKHVAFARHGKHAGLRASPGCGRAVRRIGAHPPFRASS